ncbi:MAG: ubiquinone/menaquinone biosynthesis methyltransferase [Sedimentisphaerales bacterium]|nr:ubiquinone/menaquinone biosynthesis methyltransferase [Sedimentisphaerales bacterium]
MAMVDQKTSSIERMFSEVPATYELVNHVLTMGLDVVWRRRAARIAATANGGQWADMCTGTGEMAANLSRLAPEGTTIYGIDFSEPMLEQARKKPEADNINFVVSDIKALDFPDASFDLITMSFATRNINLSKDILVQSFSEFYRVLKPGGRFVNLETSRPSFWLFRKCFHLYIKLFVKSIGSRISGSGDAYTYLATTIHRFYSAQELADIMRQAGFDKVTFQQYLLGAVAIHQAMKF